MTKPITQEHALLTYARTAVRSEVREPYNGRTAHYQSQAVMDVLNHFDWLTNSDEDFERVKDAVDTAEGELLCLVCHEALRETGEFECKDCVEA